MKKTQSSSFGGSSSSKVSLCVSLPATADSEICPQLCLHLGPRAREPRLQERECGGRFGKEWWSRGPAKAEIPARTCERGWQIPKAPARMWGATSPRPGEQASTFPPSPQNGSSGAGHPRRSSHSHLPGQQSEPGGHMPSSLPSGDLVGPGHSNHSQVARGRAQDLRGPAELECSGYRTTRPWALRWARGTREGLLLTWHGGFRHPLESRLKSLEKGADLVTGGVRRRWRGLRLSRAVQAEQHRQHQARGAHGPCHPAGRGARGARESGGGDVSSPRTRQAWQDVAGGGAGDVPRYPAAAKVSSQLPGRGARAGTLGGAGGAGPAGAGRGEEGPGGAGRGQANCTARGRR